MKLTINQATLNLNELVQVRLTDLGRKIYSEYWAKYMPHTPPEPIREINGWSKWQLWEVMSIWGQHLQNGSAIPFEIEIMLCDTRLQ